MLRYPGHGKLDDAAVRVTSDNGKFAEILVQRYQHPAFGVCLGQNLLVARIVRPVPSANQLMSGGSNSGLRAAPYAGGGILARSRRRGNSACFQSEVSGRRQSVVSGIPRLPLAFVFFQRSERGGVPVVFLQHLRGGLNVFGVFDSLQQGQVFGRYQCGNRLPAPGEYNPLAP